MASGLVWAFTVLFLAVSRVVNLTQLTSSFEIIAIIFVTSWTLWMAWLVRCIIVSNQAA
jgi:hypothetical protein